MAKATIETTIPSQTKLEEAVQVVADFAKPILKTDPTGELTLEVDGIVITIKKK